MKNTEPLAFGILLTLTLGAAYVVSQGEGEGPSEGEVVVLAPPRSIGVTGVIWTGPGGEEARLALRGEGEDARPWVTWTVTEGGAEASSEQGGEDASERAGEGDDPEGSAESGADAERGAEATGDAEDDAPQVRIFPGNQDALTLLEFYAPLKAVRSWADLTDTALTEMGLVDSEESLTVLIGDQAHRFAVGSGAYGSDHVYLRGAEGGPTYLVKSQGIRPLRRAPMRLMERDPLGLDLREVASARLVGPWGAPIDAVQRGGGERAEAFWATKDAPDTRSGALESFMDRLLKARVEGYPLEGEAAPEVEEVARATFFDAKGEELGGLALGQAGAGIGFVWSPRTGRWVPISAETGTDLSDTLKDLEGL